jgi:hypothetical protein
VTELGPHAAVAVALELVGDGADLGDDRLVSQPVAGRSR